MSESLYADRLYVEEEATSQYWEILERKHDSFETDKLNGVDWTELKKWNEKSTFSDLKDHLIHLWSALRILMTNEKMFCYTGQEESFG